MILDVKGYPPRGLKRFRKRIEVNLIHVPAGISLPCGLYLIPDGIRKAEEGFIVVAPVDGSERYFISEDSATRNYGWSCDEDCRETHGG